MSYITTIFRFGWPYLRRYWFRLFLGILLGVVFGLSNAAILGVSRSVLDRLNPSRAPKEVKCPKCGQEFQLDVSNNRIAHKHKDGTAIPVNPKLAQTFSGATEELSSMSNRLKEQLDPWLPSYGRPMDAKQVAGVLILLPFLMAFRGFIGYFSSYFMGWVSERAINDMRLHVLIKLNSLSLDFFNRSTMGDLMTRVNGDTAALHRAMNFGFSDMIKEPITIAGIIGLLCYLDWKLTLVVLVVFPVCMVPLLILGKKVRRASHGTVAAAVSQGSLLVELLSSIRIVKAFNLEQQQVEHYRNYARDLVHHGMKGIQARELVNPIIETVGAIGFGVLIVWIFYTGRSLADMVVFLGGVMMIYPSIKKLAGLHVLFQQTSVGVERLVNILKEQPSVREHPEPKSIERFEQSISFENVTFSYGHEAVLSDLNLTIPRGHRLGVAGESGSGKSTLVNLTFRFYDPTQGAIKIDGHDLRELSSRSLRQVLALVSQEVVLFDQTVAENIACGRRGATREEVEAAARSAYAHDFITKLPKGYDTRVGERGVTLSGGQRQRVAIARAFVRNAPILVLDEATAALDSQSESEVQAAIDRLAENRTVICVAHRLATLARTDCIIVLSRGRIIEQGSFAELLKKKGTFADMARRQGIMHVAGA